MPADLVPDGFEVKGAGMPVTERARYDGKADWYDAHASPWATSNHEALRALLGPGDGWCLDLGCGTGQYLELLRSTGRQVVGLDLSADQLRLARGREPRLVQANAAALPFADGGFSTVTAIWVSTDVDDFAAVVRDAARVLRPGGLFCFYGVHPCFNGPCIEDRDDGATVVHPTYRLAGWHPDSPWWREGGIRQRLGMRHVPLSDLLNAIIEAGLRVTRVVEPKRGAEPIPRILGLLAHRP